MPPNDRNVPPKITGILETCLYVEDVARSRTFYQRLFGFEALLADERIATLEVVTGQVLILFKRDATTEPIPVGDGFIPPHDGSGRQHFALSIGASEVEAWRSRLIGQGIGVESEVDWPAGGHSLYFRDPDGLLVELATPGLWAKK
jgi:catechol 2,3-dioxygenase-like lactoylglutathione lyase family enzyme